jgi:hypothetical protein
MKDTHSRFKDAPWYGTEETIVLGGLGGIGSWVSLFLSRLGYTIYGYDFDEYDRTNMAGQFVATSNIGHNKAVVAAEYAKTFSENHNFIPMGKFTKGESMVGNITIAAFDNMESRKAMFEAWKEMQLSKTERPLGEVNIFIDGRLLMEGFQIYVVNTMNRMKLYEETLFDDSDVPDLPCSAKATSHCGAMIGAMITSTLTNQITNKKLNVPVRDVPFNINMDIPLLMFETNN